MRASLLLPLDAEAQKVEALVDVDDPRLLLRETEPHGRENRCRLGPKRLGIGPRACHDNHEVVRVADEAVGGKALVPVVLSFGRAVAEPFPGFDEVLVEDREGDVREQGRKYAAL